MIEKEKERDEKKKARGGKGDDSYMSAMKSSRTAIEAIERRSYRRVETFLFSRGNGVTRVGRARVLRLSQSSQFCGSEISPWKE